MDRVHAVAIAVESTRERDVDGDSTVFHCLGLVPSATTHFPPDTAQRSNDVMRGRVTLRLRGEKATALAANDVRRELMNTIQRVPLPRALAYATVRLTYGPLPQARQQRARDRIQRNPPIPFFSRRCLEPVGKPGKP